MNPWTITSQKSQLHPIFLWTLKTWPKVNKNCDPSDTWSNFTSFTDSMPHFSPAHTARICRIIFIIFCQLPSITSIFSIFSLFRVFPTFFRVFLTFKNIFEHFGPQNKWKVLFNINGNIIQIFFTVWFWCARLQRK